MIGVGCVSRDDRSIIGDEKMFFVKELKSAWFIVSVKLGFNVMLSIGVISMLS